MPTELDMDYEVQKSSQPLDEEFWAEEEDTFIGWFAGDLIGFPVMESTPMFF